MFGRFYAEKKGYLPKTPEWHRKVDWKADIFGRKK
jgi:hypothetical protein